MIEIISLNERERWNNIIRSMPEYDFYYLPPYHELDGNGTPLLLYFDNDSDGRIALPVILREIEGSRFNDITSVYGYAGPLASPTRPASIAQFQHELRELFTSMNIVSAFSRLHPLFLWQSNLMQGLGEVKEENFTVVIDLTLSEAERKKQYSHSLKNDLNRLRKQNIQVKPAKDKEEVDSFIRIYYENMDRANATPYYYFSQDYFYRFLTNIESEILLAVYEGEIVAGTLCTYCNKIIEAHLGATRAEFLHLSPMKLLWHEVSNRGHNLGMEQFHLGGGYGGKNDSLFQFKSQFSHTRKMFGTWRYIHNPEEYNRLSAEGGFAGTESSSSYFPLYRKKQ